MEWVVNNWGTILIFLMIILGVVSIVRDDKVKAKKWLLLACIEAEKEFGSKTGAIKLRYVYDMFLATFPVLSKFITFDEFSNMVDDALEEMKHLIDTNMAVFDYVGGYSVEKIQNGGK